MDDLDTRFARMLGRAPTDAEKLRLHRVKDALGLPPTDSMWLILIALDYYLSLYEKIPARIEKISVPLAALDRAPEIVDALERASTATARVGRWWTWISAHGMIYGTIIGAALGLLFGGILAYHAAAPVYRVAAAAIAEREAAALRRREAHRDREIARIGHMYDALAHWRDRGLMIGDDAIYLPTSPAIRTGVNARGHAGIWFSHD